MNIAFIVTIVMFAISLAVAAVPEALAAIITGALAIGMQQMAKRNAPDQENARWRPWDASRVICSDKTGTLTKEKMTVRKYSPAENGFEITGAGYDPVGEFRGG